MGSPTVEENRDATETQHRVHISEWFLMGVAEVTQSEWDAVMGKNPSDFQGDNNPSAPSRPTFALPVENVSWEAAREFCRKLSEKERWTYRLPTEAEWEYACRAETTTPYNFGRGIGGDRANYGSPVTSGTRMAGSFAANAWGLYDMHGNVWEWCEDWYGKYPQGEATDPTGPAEGEFHVMRGGAWNAPSGECRAAYRNGRVDAGRGGCVGFRVVSTPKFTVGVKAQHLVDQVSLLEKR